MSISTCLFGEENRPSLDIELKVFPQKIQYGDALFAFVEIKNNTGESLVVPRRLVYGGIENYWHTGTFVGSVIQLLSDETCIYEWRDAKRLNWIDRDRFLPIPAPPPFWITDAYPRQNSESGASHIVCTTILWCPQYEFSSHPIVRINYERFVDTGERYGNSNREFSNFRVDTFKKMVASQNDFVLSSDIWVPALDLLNPDKQFRFHPNSTGMIDVRQPKNLPVRIDTRSSETRELLTRWFLEIPSTRNPDCWTIEGIFASPFYVSGSPYNVNASSPQEMYKKRELVREEYLAFYKTMESRTPEIEARIKRMKEWAEKLLALPDSEVSPHMKEFISLRGLLVDLRYAEENEAVRDKAFEKIVDWLKTSRYKTLWVLFLKECGFRGIVNENRFPMEVVERYVKKLAEAFPDEANASIADLDKEQAVAN